MTARSSKDWKGSCHCGALGFAYRTSVAPEHWPVRACQCSFCRAHGARCTSDPAGEVSFGISEPDHLLRYRFALRTVDFLICRACGVYVGAVLPTDSGGFGLVNLNAFVSPPEGLPAARATVYDAESESARVERRAKGWTPVVA